MVVKIWQFWSEVESDGRYKRVVCKYCNGHEQIKHAAKCRRHTITCAKVPTSIKEMLKLSLNSSKMIAENDSQQILDDGNDFEDTTAVETIVADSNASGEPRMEISVPAVCVTTNVMNSTPIYSKVKRIEKDSPRVFAKGGRNRNSNILSAALCLIKELDFASLEVLDTAIHCRMEEIDQNY